MIIWRSPTNGGRSPTKLDEAQRTGCEVLPNHVKSNERAAKSNQTCEFQRTGREVLPNHVKSNELAADG